MDSKDKSIIQIHLTDEYILPYIIEESLLDEHLVFQTNEDIIHNARYNQVISIKNTHTNIKISRSLIKKSLINSN